MALTIAEIETAIHESNGIITSAARRLGVTRDALYKRMEKSQRLKTAVQSARESTRDLAESMLIKKIKDGDTTSIIFYLKTQGKDRGYTERQEISGPDNGPIVMKGYTNVSPDDL